MRLKTAIFRRFHVLTTQPNDPECEAMKNATRALRVLLVKELGFPSFSK